MSQVFDAIQDFKYDQNLKSGKSSLYYNKLCKVEFEKMLSWTRIESGQLFLIEFHGQLLSTKSTRSAFVNFFENSELESDRSNSISSISRFQKRTNEGIDLGQICLPKDLYFRNQTARNYYWSPITNRRLVRYLSEALSLSFMFRKSVLSWPQ